MSVRKGYDAIPQRQGDEEDAGDGSSTSPLLQPTRTRPQTQWDNLKQTVKKHQVIVLCCFLGMALVVIALIAAFCLPGAPETDNVFFRPPVKPGISRAAMQQGRAQCARIQQVRRRPSPDEHRTNPRGRTAQPILLQNATVWDGQGQVLPGMDILMANGVIAAMGTNLDPGSAEVMDVQGHVVSPGLVDMHSHLGVDSWPYLAGTSDTNEETAPLTPFVRSLDAFNPSDVAIPIVASGGVTTALVLPGSGNLMGGEAYVFKLRNMPSTSVEDMLVQAGVDPEGETPWRWMKMACGENPKRVYGSRGEMPSTRLGEAYLFRQGLAEAQHLMQQQDDWCQAAEHLESGHRLDTRFPEDLSLESLVALLRGDVLLNVHCYETHDIEAMIRHSLEFNFTIAAFHHALDAYRIPDVLKRASNNITVATFADNWGYKKEAFQATPLAPKILHDAGIPVALKSDHPVINSQHLMFEAAKSAHYGLPDQAAFQAVTSVPAAAIGLGHRVGTLRVGYDADVVIWDREPLDLGAAPLQVFIDGHPLFESRPVSPFIPSAHTQAVVEKGTNELKDFTITGARIFWQGTETQGKVMVKDGKITCVGEECVHDAEDVPTIDVEGGYVIPGIIAAGSSLGMTEIPSESSTGDGIVPPSNSQKAEDIVEAIDGIKLGTRHLEEALKGGVMAAITAPRSRSVVQGISVAFKTGASSVLVDDAVISRAVALHIQIGEAVKSPSFPTISTQISFLRRLFQEHDKATNYYGQAARGEIPVVVSVDNKDEIASVILLKRQFSHMRFVILGGAESHLVARHLADADIAVILKPTLCTPGDFASQHCLTGAPLTNGTAAHVLHRHGVKLGLGVQGDGYARNLAWDAGWIAATSNKDTGEISEAQAVQFITTHLQDIFGLTPSDALANNLVVWSGSPFDLHSRPILTFTPSDGTRWL